MSSTVMVNRWPSTSVTEPSVKRPVRILGPCRSTSMPTALPDSSNLGTLQIDEYAHCPARLLAGLANLGVGRFVLLVAPVRAVDPSDVQARVNERPYPPGHGCCGTKCADDLCAAHDDDSIGGVGISLIGW